LYCRCYRFRGVASWKHYGIDALSNVDSAAGNVPVGVNVRHSKDPQKPYVKPVRLEAVGGAVPLDSQFYIVRPTDDDFYAAIDRASTWIISSARILSGACVQSCPSAFLF
jgi:hypothetical protein